MKKITILFLILSTTIISGCFGGGDSADTVINTESEFRTGEFQIIRKSTWETFTKKDFTSDVPGNTEVIFRSRKKNEIFIANINITKNILAENISAEDYGKKMLQSSTALFLNFKRIDDKKTDTGYIIMYQGKENAGDPLLEFIQHIVVKDKKVFIATTAYNPVDDEQVRKEAQEIVRSLKAL